MAMSRRPCTSCPSPGMKKLQSAAMTLPVDPGCVISLGIKRVNRSESLFLIEVFSDFKLRSGRFIEIQMKKVLLQPLKHLTSALFSKSNREFLVWQEST